MILFIIIYTQISEIVFHKVSFDRFSPIGKDIFVRVDVIALLKRKDIDQKWLKERKKTVIHFFFSTRRTRNSSGGTHGRSPWNGSSLKENEFKVNNTLYSWVFQRWEVEKYRKISKKKKKKKMQRINLIVVLILYVLVIYTLHSLLTKLFSINFHNS